MNEFLFGLQPAILNLVALSLVGLIGIGIAVLFKWRKVLIVRFGAETFDAAREFAIGLYTMLEDQFADVLHAGAEKKAEMDKLLLAKFPSLTQADLDSINKAVWAAMQELEHILDPAE
jgi:hypothetical protein